MTEPRISVFPKCYFDLLCRGKMDYVQWIRSAAELAAEGVEHYDGFFRSYKDGNWFYPEFAQPEDIFLEILERVDSPHLGVQYDPSNALVGGSDPIAFLR